MTQPLAAIWGRALAPEPDLKPWEWCERNVKNIPYSPVPGGFSSAHHPAIREVMETICDPAVPLVVLKCAVQTIKTLALELSITWAVKNDPAPTLFLQDQDANAKDEMQMRLRPLMENTEAVKQLIPIGADKDKAKNASILFRNGMPLWVLGASNPRNLQRRSIRRVFLDECWMYPPDRMAIKEASARVTAFGYLGKVVAASQGSEENDEFDKLHKETDQREWNVACPECECLQPLAWSNVKFTAERDDNGNYNYPEIAPTVHYECAKCQAKWEDTDEMRRDLNATGRFVATNESAPKGKVGFTVNSISSMPWAILVEMYLSAKVASWTGDIGPLKVFYQKRLAWCWGDGNGEDFKIEVKGSGYKLEDAEKWEDESILSMRAGFLKIGKKPEGELPPGNFLFRVMTVDVQQACFFYVVRSWSRDGKSRLLKAGRAISWNDLDALATRYNLCPQMVMVDSGNQPAVEVYPNTAARGWTCLRGDQRRSFPHRDKIEGRTFERYYSTVRKVPLSKGKVAKVFHWSNLNCKDMLARMLRMPERWQIADDILDSCPEYHDAMNSERRVKRNKIWQWEEISKSRPNHLWDCEAMQIVAGLMTKVIGAEIEAEKVEPETESE